VGRGAAFSEILEEKLGAHPMEELRRGVASSPPPPPAPTSHPHAFVFFSSAPGLGVHVSPHANPRCWKAPRPSRPTRNLRSTQQRAFDELVSLGAGLHPDFTTEELRSAFRRLAREYHPDTHPNSGEPEKQRLSAIFGRVRDAYEDLQAA
jgi:hypothetical protein